MDQHFAELTWDKHFAQDATGNYPEQYLVAVAVAGVDTEAVVGQCLNGNEKKILVLYI